MNRRRLALTLTALVAILLGGCGEDRPEERLAEIEEQFEEATRDAKIAHRDLERLRARVEAQETELEEARRELAAAQRELVASAERADSRVTDVALFRALQTRMLEEELLEPLAVRVRVENRVVTLEGEVDTPEQAQRALEIARESFGVSRVRNELTSRKTAAPSS